MHDKNGNPLKVGDEVTLRGRITSVSPSTDRCNITVETAENGEPFQTHTLTASEVELTVGEGATPDESSTEGDGDSE